MSLLQSYRNLPFKAKLGVGAGLVAWGLIGTYMSDRAEEKFGLTPTEADKAALNQMLPKVQLVERGQGR